MSLKYEPSSEPLHIPETSDPEPGIRNPELGTRNPEPRTRSLKLGTRNPEPETRNPKPETPNPKPEAPHPNRETRDTGSLLHSRQTQTLRSGLVTPSPRLLCACVHDSRGCYMGCGGVYIPAARSEHEARIPDPETLNLQPQTLVL